MAVKQTLTLHQVSQDAQNNTSQVRILWQSTQSGSSYNNTSRTASYYVSVNGGAETETQIPYTLPYQATKTLLDKTITVQHDDSGNGYVAVRTWMNTNISAGVVQLSKTLTLTQIPKESTLTASHGFIGKTSRLAVTKKGSSYTHSIAYSFGLLSGFVTATGGSSATEVKFSGETVDFTLPESFYSQIPGSPSGTCTLTIRTYAGSTLIGQPQTARFTANADPEACRPALSCTVTDVNAATKALTGNSDILVCYHSDARCSLTATAKNGATVSQKKVGNQVVSGDYLDIAAVESGKFTFSAVDSRGFAASTAVTKTMIAYVRLTNNAQIARTDPTSGNAVLTLSGNCFQGSFGAAENGLTLRYRVGSGSFVAVTPTVSGSTYRATVSLTGLSYEESHTVTVSAADKLESVTKTLTLGKGLPVFDWGERDFAFHVPVELDTALSMANGGTGRKDWGGLDTDYAIMAKSPNGAWMTAIGTQNGAFYADAANGAPRFGTLPVAQGGTGAVTPAAARSALGAAPAWLTSQAVTVASLEELDGVMTTIFGGMTNQQVKFVSVQIGGTLYCLRLWRATNLYGNAELWGYNLDRGSRRRVYYNGNWSDWQYDAPPMYLGEEYQTTARWQGKPVYTKLIDFGELPNSTTKSVAHGAAAARILRAEGQASNGQAFPICGTAFYNIALRAGLTHIDISTDYNYSAYTATVQLWYTKE